MIYELLKDRIMNGGAGSEAIIQSLSIQANGVYTAPSGTDGYNPITVNVPQEEPSIQNLSITANGTYTAPSGTDGYSPVVVDVQPNLENITITANGTYSHAGKDGYDQVVVNVPQQGLDVSNITIKDSPTGLFSNNKWSELMPYFRNITINPSSSWNLNNLYMDSDYTDLSHITFKMQCDMNYFAMQRVFQDCMGLTVLPNFDWSSTSAGAPNSSFSTSSIFYNCTKLRTIPDTFFSDIPLSDSYTEDVSGDNMFSYCYSLRKVPDLSWFDGKNTYFSYSSIYYYMFNQCYSLDEIVDLPVFKASNSPTTNGFEREFYGCYRVKEITFKTGTDLAPRTDSGWNSQVIDLSQNIGYYAYNAHSILGCNSGITADKEVTDDASYQALKNDPDWFTGNPAYSRYNHDSAVNTINSLPDCSSSGTNTIKFLGASGSATDGGAISTLTAEEIAVATAKGWTVTLV